MLLLVDFTGPMRERLQSQLGLGVVGAVFVLPGTLASRNAWLGAALMVIVGFGVLFAGVVSSILAGASTSLLLAFVLPVSVAAPPSSIPDRLGGLGTGLGGLAAGHLAAVADPDPQSVARPGERRVPGSVDPAAHRRRVVAAAVTAVRRTTITRASLPRDREREGSSSSVSGDALPPDRSEPGKPLRSSGSSTS